MTGEVPLLEVRELKKTFAKPRTFGDLVMRRRPLAVQAVRGVSFAIRAGETLGLVGESGCGKSTLGRCIAGLHAPSAGEILFRGEHIGGRTRNRKTSTRTIQMIFQDPYSSLNPRMTVAQMLGEALRVHGLRGRGEIADRVDELLDMTGLSAGLKHHLPHAFSGGQRQRISIARALAVEPELIIADEPVSALDVSIQAQILNLFERLGRELLLTYLFVAHDLNVVRHISDRIAVMYLGEIVELADADAIFDDPQHPYTRALLSAIPQPDPTRRTAIASLEGELPDPASPPLGCGFSARCPVALPDCHSRHPELVGRGDRLARCVRAFERS
jgi:oligopeptide/dipeptide ABC transporter ATP-binding protein